MSLNCTVCYLGYDDADLAPLLLPCGHTLCKSCATNPSLKFCPLDRSELPANRAVLRKNYSIADMVELVRAGTRTQLPLHTSLAGLVVQPSTQGSQLHTVMLDHPSYASRPGSAQVPAAAPRGGSQKPQGNSPDAALCDEAESFSDWQVSLVRLWPV